MTAYRPTSRANEPLRRFLAALYRSAPPAAFVEVRYRHTQGMRRAFSAAECLGDAAEMITRRSRHTDVYVGVIPRRRRGGGRADLVECGSVLWADCDGVDSADALRAFTPAPSLILRSGSGPNLHGYWLLSEPLALDDIETANRRLAHALGADMACTDPARIMRPVTSLNWKETPPAEVRLDAASTGELHSIAPILRKLPEIPQPVRASRARHDGVRTSDDSLLDIEPTVYVELLAGVPVPRSRKIACPFHDDHNPSLHVYRDAARGWYCYGCRRGGSIYDFGGATWQIPTRGADFVKLRRRLAERFRVRA